MKKKSASRKPAVLSEGVSIYAVAEKAGVSIVTVSRVFNDYPHVSQRMRHRVFAAARDVGYTPRLVSKPKVMAVIVGAVWTWRLPRPLPSRIQPRARSPPGPPA